MVIPNHWKTFARQAAKKQNFCLVESYPAKEKGRLLEHISAESGIDRENAERATHDATRNGTGGKKRRVNGLRRDGNGIDAREMPCKGSRTRRKDRRDKIEK